MSNRSIGRTQRCSRPPSLSTIGSNEEADFSSSRRNRQTFQSTYSVSPLEEYSATFHYQQTPVYTNRIDDRSVPSNLPAYQSENVLPGKIHNEFLVYSSDEERGGIDYKLEKPKGAVTKSSFFGIPIMDRTGTGLSDRSVQSGYETSIHTSDGGSMHTGDEKSIQYGEEPPRKYMKTRFMWMLLQLDQIPWWHNLLAATSAWIILAAYLVVPGSFTSFSKNNEGFDPKNITNTPEGHLNAFANQIVNGIEHLGLLIFSAILASVGVLMCLVLFWVHWQNYVWLNWKIFQPMMLNSLAGLLTTIVNVKTTQKGDWSLPAKVNASVTGAVAAIAGSLFILYNFFLIENVRKQHRKHFPVDAELVDPMKQRRMAKIMHKGKGYYT